MNSNNFKKAYGKKGIEEIKGKKRTRKKEEKRIEFTQNMENPTVKKLSTTVQYEPTLPDPFFTPMYCTHPLRINLLQVQSRRELPHVQAIRSTKFR